jgi:phage terminase large subunit
MQRNGFKIVPAIKGAGSLEDGVEFLKNFDIVVHPRCKHVADELTLYSYKTDPLTGVVLPQLEDKRQPHHRRAALRLRGRQARRQGSAERAHVTGEHGWMSRTSAKSAKVP